MLAFQKRVSSTLHSSKEENIFGHSFETRAYEFVLKPSRVFLIPTRRLEREW